MQIPGQLKSSHRAALHANWLWTVVIGLVIAGCLYVGVTTWRDEGTVELSGALVVGLMSLAWMALLAWTIRRQLEWNALGEAVVILKPSIPVVGQALVCNVQFDRRPEGDTTASADLSCERVTETGIGDKRKTHRQELWREKKTSPSAAMMYFTFHPPAHLPPDSGGTRLSDFWWLQVSGRGATRFSRRFRVPFERPLEREAATGGRMRSADVATAPFLDGARAAGEDIGRWISRGLGLLFAAVVFSVLVWMIRENFSDTASGAGEDGFRIKTEGLSGELRLGDLRHLNFSNLGAELRGRFAWDGKNLRIDAEQIVLIPRNCAPDCPRIDKLWLTLTSWQDLGGNSSSGNPLAQTEALDVDYSPRRDEVIALGRQQWTMKMEQHADPRTASLVLHVQTGDRDSEFGLSFGGAEWRGLERRPGDSAACAVLETPVAAIDHFCTPRLAQLLPRFASPAGRGQLLMQAARRGNLEAVDLLLTAGAKADTISSRGFTALMEAASGNLPDVMQRLIEAGANVDYRDSAESEYGHPTPLGVALLSGSDEGARLLIGRGASLELAHYGSPPVHVAVEMDMPGVLALMKEKGADLDQRAAWGNQPTPLMAAAGTGKLALIGALLALGVDPATGDSAGNTARDYAATNAQPEALKRLESFPGICPLTGCGT